MNFYLSPEISVRELFNHEPKLIELFMDLKLDCVGCPIDEFHTLADVAKENNLDLDHLLKKIQKTLSGNEETINDEKESLMNEKSTTGKGTPFNLKQSVDYASDSVVSKTLLKKNIGNITLFAFDKGQGLSEHTAPYDAAIYILDGDAEITLGGKSKNVSAGEMLIMPANIPHSLKANVPFKMLLVMIREE